MINSWGIPRMASRDTYKGFFERFKKGILFKAYGRIFRTGRIKDTGMLRVKRHEAEYARAGRKYGAVHADQ
jgi:hypothetical protein